MDRQLHYNMAAVPCTCGELFQGTLDREPCLVSCPIDSYSSGQFAELSEPGQPQAHQSAGGRKVARALEIIAARVGRRLSVQVEDTLPSGRGYGTSTADIGAALFAASRALDLNLTAAEASHIAVQIEPTDSTFFAGLNLFDHRSALFNQPLGSAPPARLLILDPGGAVDTEEFNARDLRKPLAKLAQQHLEAFTLLQQGIKTGDLLVIGASSTLSAAAHQSILPNSLVDLALPLSKQLGAAGICRAHSGTIVGLIFPQDYDQDAVLEYLSVKLPANVQIRPARLVDGGPRYAPADKPCLQIG
ncbi:MAG: hypothetical protein P4L50_28920 [Anaerolineaceae bacterium]|nr:hypothetical protein [Anaerolineaceae bacterium]